MLHRRKGHSISRRLLTMGPALGLAALLGFAAPAGAAGTISGPTGGNSSTGYHLIVVGGSQATYRMVLGLATIFNEAPGCDLATASGTTQPLDFGCPGINDAGGSLSATNNPSNTVDVGEDGFTPFATENPFNDVLVEIPALGSSNGIKELEDQATHAPASEITIPDVTVTAGSATLTATGTGASTFSGVSTGWYASGVDQGIPSGDTVSTVSSTSITLATAVSASATTGVYSVTFSSSQSGVNVGPLDIATSSRAPNVTVTGSAGDDKGLNFVAYAMDGVSWLHWTAAPAVASGTTNQSGTPAATPSQSVTNLSIANLQSIFEGTLSCTESGQTLTMNWECVGGTDAPIDVYWAQPGSGTESTWANLLGLSSSGTPSTYYTGTPALASSHIIFENETASIIANGDEADAIFFFSYGNFGTQCTASAGYCGAEPTGWATGSSLALGAIGGNAVDEASIESQLPGGTNPITVSNGATSGTKAAKLTSGTFPAAVLAGDSVKDSGNCIPSGTTVTLVKTSTKVKLSNKTTGSCASDTLTFTPPAPFPGDRLLYNVYSDGSNPDIPASSLAALNAVSEDGFLCKPSTASDVDPNTGATYRTEIDNAVEANGFFPLPLGVETGTYDAPSGNGGPYGGTSIANPAWTLPAVTTGSEVGGLGSSAYDNTVETGQPYNFPAADTDTDDSAVSGSYTINGTSVTATTSAPVGYCLVLSSDGNSTN